MPTITVSDNSGATYSGSIDTYIQESSPTTNDGNSPAMDISMYAGGDHKHGLLAFTGLSNVVGPVTVDPSSSIQVRVNFVSAAQTMMAYRLKRPWVELQATWNIYSTGNNWATAGGIGAADIDVACASVVCDTSDAYVSLTGTDMAAVMQGWVNGTFPNYGLLLMRSDGSNDGKILLLFSSEEDNGYRPILTLNYSTGGGGSTIKRWPPQMQGGMRSLSGGMS